jgi:hypothetical protein
MTFTLDRAAFTVKVTQLAQAGVILIGDSGKTTVPGHPELTIQYTYTEPTLIIQVEGANFVERGIAGDKIRQWMAN